jgi:hypothetical protein
VERLSRAISIRQPYVERILNGTKKAEFRSRRTLIRERVYLYVSMQRSIPQIDLGAVSARHRRNSIPHTR